MIIDAPFFRARLIGDKVEVSGQARQLLSPTPALAEADRGNSLFVEWVWDGETLTVTNDRFGMAPAYYYASGTEIMVSPSIPKLIELGAPVDFDYDAIATFFALTHFVGDDTPFLKIRSLGPAARLTWRSGKLDVTSSPVFVGTKPISRDRAIDGYIDLMRQAVARRSPVGTFAVPITGGRDSRHILLELHRSGHRPSFAITCNQYPPIVSDDVRVGREIAEALGIRHVTVDAPKHRFVAELDSLENLSFASIGMSQYANVAGYCRENATTLYDGLAGDILSAGGMLSRARLDLWSAGRLEDVARSWSSDHGPLLKINLKRSLARRISYEAAIARIVRELKRHEGAGSPLTSFVLHNRTRRRIAQQPLCNYAGVKVVHTPFLDTDLASFLLALPVSITVDGTFHTETIHKAYPEYRGIPFENNWRSVSDVRHFVTFSRDVLRYLLANKRSRNLRVPTLALRYAAASTIPKIAPRVSYWASSMIYFLAIERAISRAGEKHRPYDRGP